MQTDREATSITVDTSLKAESLLLEDLRHLSANTTQINSEISGTFNVYLIAVGITAIGVGTLQIFHTDLFHQGYTVTPFFLDVVTIVVLIFGSILSFIFLLRFLHLAKREFRNNVAMNKTRTFCINYLKAQMPTLEEAFYKQDDTKFFSNVPPYIRYTVSLIGSLCFGGAFYIILSYIAMDTFFIFKNLFLSICIFIAAFFLQQLYYHLSLPEIKGDAISTVVDRHMTEKPGN
jgi:hypothetical protein